MVRYHAAWVLPIVDVPIRDGWVVTDQGRIVAYGELSSRTPLGDAVPEVDLGEVAILPGLVNAHTHLELSYLRDEVPPTSEFVPWVRAVMAARRQWPDPNASAIVSAIDRAVAECVASGTAVVGDITNTLVPWASVLRSPLAGVLFYELIRFASKDAEAFVARALHEIEALPRSPRVRISLAAHAPYSVAPLVFRAIRRVLDRDAFVPGSVHLAESAEEMEFIQTGGGPWRQLLEDVGAWDPSWIPPGGSPVEFLEDAGFFGGRMLAVHGVQMTPDDLALLAARGVTLVTCPRSNGHTGAGAPPLEAFYASGVRVAVGTDSLASSPDLNVFAEIATMRALAPTVPASRLLASATSEGAYALGFEAEYGTIEPGKAARLLAVSLPPGTVDVEEYLVSGVLPDQVRWLE